MSSQPPGTSVPPDTGPDTGSNEPTSPPPPPPPPTSQPEPPTSPTQEPPPPPPPPTSEPAPTSDSNPPQTSQPAPPPPPPPVIVTVPPTGTRDPTTIFITSTTTPPAALPPVNDPSQPVEPIPSTSSTDDLPAGSDVPASGGSNGMTGGAKIAIAVAVPIVGVALISILFLFLWRRYKKRRNEEEMRRKEVEEYAYNPNNDSNSRPLGNGAMGAVGGRGADENQYEMSEGGGGYRGWGSTAGGRKASAPLSTGASGATPLSPVGLAYSETAYGGNSNSNNSGGPGGPGGPGGTGTGAMLYQPSELYGGSTPSSGGIAPASGGAAFAAHAQNSDRHSHSPLLPGAGNRPSTADSSTIGAAGVNSPAELDEGLRRGDSVASSRYTTATRRSDVSEANGPLMNYSANNYYANDGPSYYDETNANYPPPQEPHQGQYDSYGVHQEESQPPLIQQVSARRNTRIENASGHSGHYPQVSNSGTSGIAQNF